ncbi:unnamed protein product (macronuclear) [Paramecium tetraurelia]|uniref:RING-type E3 ubiquitin transferase n=1 Tax=Paramecium tetraurelia TaxID=5888 RepID=A0EGT3_PARTE|nr:uncharacterized protein GSPATT00026848001 [Paramecium tetraurelia]CAK94524.1 unnamed protein product [Paramecium tetraurelia]|eukprot:XP_001461897.1 hypothetical protein (macronuclear) [Paramecium tetraurelia strain d4-2]
MAAMDYNISKITPLLLIYRYHGEWESLTNNVQNYLSIIAIQYLEQTKGETFIQFNPQQDLTQNELSLAKIGSFNIIFLDPIYFDEKLVVGLSNITDMNETTLSWHGKTDFVYYKYYKEKGGYPNVSCEIEYDIQLNYNEDEVDSKKIDITIQLRNEVSDNKECNIQLISQYQLYQSNHYKQILFYSVMLNILCAIQYFCVTKIIDSVVRDDENSIVQRISIFCVGFVTIYDTFLAIKNLSFAFGEAYFPYFIFPSFFFFMLTMNCDLKLLWIICRIRFQDQFLDQQSQRQFLTKFFIIYCMKLIYQFQLDVSVLTLFLLLQEYELYNSFLLVIGFFMTPQIIHNIRQGINPKFIPEYIFGFLSINIAVPLYFRGYPNNFRRLKPSPEFCVCLVLIYLIQILILYLQYKKGPRKIIPKCLLPKQYNYYQDYKTQELEDCAICLLHLMIEPDQQEQDLDRMLVSKLLMITPCGHKFHPSCLKSWMEVKLSCPTCRNTIPPMCE